MARRSILKAILPGMAAAFLLTLGQAAPAAAQAPGSGESGQSESAESPEDPQAAREARDRFQAGMEHYNAHRYRQAVHEFELAASLVPSADIWFNIAKAYEGMRSFPAAVEYFRRYLRDRVDPPDREEVEQHIEDLEARAEEERQRRRRAPTTGTLAIHCNVEGATVTVDGSEVGETPIAAPLTLQPGEHEIQVEKEGYMPFRAQHRLQAGDTASAFTELHEATVYQAVHGTRIFTWVAAGLSLASFGGSIALGVMAEGTKNDWQAGMPMDPGLLDEARNQAMISDILLGAGVALAVTAAILYFIEGRAVATERVAGGETALLRF